MSVKMSYNDLLKGFEACESEIKSLRSELRLKDAELLGINRVLEAVNSHKPKEPRVISDCPDIIWKIRDTKNFLKEKILESENKKVIE